MNVRLALLLAVFLGFFGYSLFVAEVAGPLGFVELAFREHWGMQLFLDVGIAMTLFSAWLIPDARARGAIGWPWVVACFALGSIGALGYLVARELSKTRATAPTAARPAVVAANGG